MPSFFPESVRDSTRVMMFVDGENLAKRYAATLGSQAPASHVVFKEDVYAWSSFANRTRFPQVVRRFYYTSAPGDQPALAEVEQALRDAGIQAPRVFHRPKSGRSKRVDITLATDMLTHAHRGNYDLAVLVAGDEDYVPLVEAVMGEGQQVVLWFLKSGLSGALRSAADHFWNLEELFLNDPSTNPAFHALFA